ncbi:hypothetical protein CEUSTIGMA_g9063.t1 [Chlamydomonas eustigma]|uniref:non-specific protein-tyrosine kinase n=1 Tax=Chlamydomonas eustigma TaxID=1157962 RepID=A0A250XEY3_9CHLO|nr:hypothetical protein CEUSTIGMA_g9063.t1 [Chlamydomonas eustigma]|eukprot:GAX81635.1 hypothetical protein CEUSTIGMA_g9063.t1 [Chlamydomonas eustigma]
MDKETKDLLEEWKLQKYCSGLLNELGVVEVNDLWEVTEEELAQLGCSRIEIRRFFRNRASKSREGVPDPSLTLTKAETLVPRIPSGIEEHVHTSSTPNQLVKGTGSEWSQASSSLRSSWEDSASPKNRPRRKNLPHNGIHTEGQPSLNPSMHQHGAVLMPLSMLAGPATSRQDANQQVAIPYVVVGSATSSTLHSSMDNIPESYKLGVLGTTRSSVGTTNSLMPHASAVNSMETGLFTGGQNNDVMIQSRIASIVEASEIDALTRSNGWRLDGSNLGHEDRRRSGPGSMIMLGDRRRSGAGSSASMRSISVRSAGGRGKGDAQPPSLLSTHGGISTTRSVYFVVPQGSAMTSNQQDHRQMPAPGTLPNPSLQQNTLPASLQPSQGRPGPPPSAAVDQEAVQRQAPAPISDSHSMASASGKSSRYDASKQDDISQQAVQPSLGGHYHQDPSGGAVPEAAGGLETSLGREAIQGQELRVKKPWVNRGHILWRRFSSSSSSSSSSDDDMEPITSFTLLKRRLPRKASSNILAPEDAVDVDQPQQHDERDSKGAATDAESSMTMQESGTSHHTQLTPSNPMPQSDMNSKHTHDATAGALQNNDSSACSHIVEHATERGDMTIGQYTSDPCSQPSFSQMITPAGGAGSPNQHMLLITESTASADSPSSCHSPNPAASIHRDHSLFHAGGGGGEGEGCLDNLQPVSRTTNSCSPLMSAADQSSTQTTPMLIALLQNAELVAQSIRVSSSQVSGIKGRPLTSPTQRAAQLRAAAHSSIRQRNNGLESPLISESYAGSPAAIVKVAGRMCSRTSSAMQPACSCQEDERYNGECSEGLSAEFGDAARRHEEDHNRVEQQLMTTREEDASSFMSSSCFDVLKVSPVVAAKLQAVLDGQESGLDLTGTNLGTNLGSTACAQCGLDLTGSNLGDDGGGAIAALLNNCPNLQRVRLDSCQLSSSSVQQVVAAVAINQSLESISLGCNDIDDAGALEVAAACHAHPSLSKLQMWNNLIGPEGANYIGRALQSGSLITVLNLRGNSRLGDQGCAELLSALRQGGNTSLSWLSLGGTGLGPAGALALAAWLSAGGLCLLPRRNHDAEFSSSLLKPTEGHRQKAIDEVSGGLTAGLEVGVEAKPSRNDGDPAVMAGSDNCRPSAPDSLIGEDLVQHLNSTARACPLKTLYIGDNRLGERGSIVLAAALATPSCQLSLLDMHANHIGPAGGRALAASLTLNTSLTHLDLSHNVVGAEGACALAAALMGVDEAGGGTSDVAAGRGRMTGLWADSGGLIPNSTLLHLNVWDNGIGEQGRHALTSAQRLRGGFSSRREGGGSGRSLSRGMKPHSSPNAGQAESSRLFLNNSKTGPLRQSPKSIEEHRWHIVGARNNVAATTATRQDGGVDVKFTTTTSRCNSNYDPNTASSNLAAVDKLALVPGDCHIHFLY